MKFKTTFWQDFTIAEHFGKAAILDTYRRAFREWRTNVEYLAELSLVLNWKIWQHYESGNDAYARLYDGLWKEVDGWAYSNLTGNDLTYYFRYTD